jgi:hypothetical protein
MVSKKKSPKQKSPSKEPKKPRIAKRRSFTKLEDKKIIKYVNKHLPRFPYMTRKNEPEQLIPKQLWETAAETVCRF